MTNRWKTSYRLMAGCLALGLLSNLPHAVMSARAQSMNSPSARAAVRLKYNPPNNWIRHYLGDDRYKIAGGIWKVVSTQTDTYYHRPNCPNMRRQPAGIVIGFADSVEAEEGGYVADPHCAPGASSVTYSTISSTGTSGQNGQSTSAAAQGTRIVLSDGRSTVILPRGWRHQKMPAQNLGGAASSVNYSADILVAPSNRGVITFAFMNAPNNTNVESMLTPAKVAELRQQFQQQQSSNSRFGRALEGAQVNVGKLGGLSGITVVPGRGAKLPAGFGGRATIVGRGSKMYIMSAQMPSTDKSYGVVVNSFKAN